MAFHPGIRRLVIAVFLLATGCAGLYSSNPRYGHKKTHPRLRPKPAPVHIADKRKGRLRWPVVGKVTGTYGIKVDPKYGTKTKNLGLDIACAPGSPVKAVAAGRVSFADHFMGYGKTVILDHGERLHSIYSKLEEIKVSVGARVAKGEVIAFAGDVLHFEVRKEGKSEDPGKWLAPR